MIEEPPADHARLKSDEPAQAIGSADPDRSSSSSSVDATARLIEIRQREQKATKGPWRWLVARTMRHLQAGGMGLGLSAPVGSNRDYAAPNVDADADFVENAREDITYLLSSVDAVQVRVHQPDPDLDGLLTSLRQPVDYGGYDGHGPDGLHMAAAKAIEHLRMARDNQLEINNAWQKRAYEAEARVSHLERENEELLRARDLQSHGDGLDLRENLNGKAASE